MRDFTVYIFFFVNLGYFVREEKLEVKSFCKLKKDYILNPDLQMI